MDITQLLPVIIQLFVVVALPAISTCLTTYLRNKTSELKKNTANAELKTYLDIAENAITTSVAAINQIYVDSIKKSNGFLTPEEQKVAFSMAKGRILSILGDSGIRVLSELYKDFNVWMDNRIEYHVSQAKIKDNFYSI